MTNTLTYNAYDDSNNSSDEGTSGALTHDEAINASYKESQANMAFSAQTNTHQVDNSAAADVPVFTSYAGAGDSIAFSQITPDSTVTIGGYETTVQAAISAGLLSPTGQAIGQEAAPETPETSTDTQEVEPTTPTLSEDAQTTLSVIDTFAPTVVDEVIEGLTSPNDEVYGDGMDNLETVLGESAMDKVNELVAETEAHFDAHFGSGADNLRAICEEFSHTPAVQEAMRLAAYGDMSGFERVKAVAKGG